MSTTDTKTELKVGLAFLGDIFVQMSTDAEQFTNLEGTGPHLGGGAGTVSGPKLNGSIKTDFYEEIGETYCLNGLAGYIDTDDGARIDFTTRGHALVHDKATDGESWSMTHSVHFTTDDKRYAWLNGQLGTWNGEFHMGTYQHNYKAYVASVERVAAGAVELVDGLVCAPDDDCD